MSSAATTFANELVSALRLTAPIDPVDVARQLGLEVEYCQSSGFEGALVCSKEKRVGTILIKNSIREDGRRRFTIAHEIARITEQPAAFVGRRMSRTGIGLFQTRNLKQISLRASF